MNHVLILTHGNLAQELLSAAEVIAGEQPDFEAVALDWQDSPESAREKLQAALDRHGDDEETLILTDIYGGTPCNVALSLAEPGRIEVVTGVNLPMVVRLKCMQGTCNGGEMSLTERADWLRTKGQQSICVATGKALTRTKGCEEEAAS